MWQNLKSKWSNWEILVLYLCFNVMHTHTVFKGKYLSHLLILKRLFHGMFLVGHMAYWSGFMWVMERREIHTPHNLLEGPNCMMHHSGPRVSHHCQPGPGERPNILPSSGSIPQFDHLSVQRNESSLFLTHTHIRYCMNGNKDIPFGVELGL
jgi:hypothetical protein